MRLTIANKVSSKNCLDGSDTLLLLTVTLHVVSTTYSKMKWGFSAGQSMWDSFVVSRFQAGK